MNDDRPSFQRGVVRPIQCFKDGWQLIKDDYWLFLGITVVGVLIASVVPFGILLGPMFCGIFYCLFRRARGQELRFEMLFRGFDHFVQSLIAALIMFVPFFVVFLIGYIAFLAALFSSLPAQPGAQPGPRATGTIVGAYVVFIVLILVTQIVLQVLFFFTFPLIVDRRLKGIEAIKTSVRASMANFTGVLGIVLLNVVLNFLGELACCIGWFFVLPLHFAAIFTAYRAVFPEGDLPPPAPPEGEAADYDDGRLDEGPA